MKLRVTQKILVGYFAIFVLLIAFAALTFFNGKRIEATIIALSQEKIPGLIAASRFKNNLQQQTNHLYELYATNDLSAFNKRHQQNADSMQKQLTALQQLPEFNAYEAQLAELNRKQVALTEKFVQVMATPEVDWDTARLVLADFSQGADGIGKEMDKLTQAVADNTLARAEASKELTQQLIDLVWLLTLVTFLGIIGVTYYSNRFVAQPLREVSASLADIAVRKDLTYRIKHQNEDEVGDIANATNHLLHEFQLLARTLDGTAQALNRTTGSLAHVTEMNGKDLQGTATKLKGLADNLHAQIRLLNF